LLIFLNLSSDFNAGCFTLCGCIFEQFLPAIAHIISAALLRLNWASLIGLIVGLATLEEISGED